METIKMVPLNDYVGMRLEIERLNELVVDLTQKLKSTINISPGMCLEKGVFVYENGLNKFIKHEHIIMIKAESNYSIIYFEKGNAMLTSKTLKHWEEKCSVDYLKRVHKSYIININRIQAFEAKTKTIILDESLKAHSSRTFKRVVESLS